LRRLGKEKSGVGKDRTGDLEKQAESREERQAPIEKGGSTRRMDSVFLVGKKRKAKAQKGRGSPRGKVRERGLLKKERKEATDRP